MKILNIIGILLVTSSFLMAKDSTSSTSQVGQTKKMKVYESPTCGCCGIWSEYMSKNGFEVEEIKTLDFMKIKEQYNIKPELMSCHTAVVDGYIIEGHTPYDEVKRLLEEKPKDVIGLSTPGMPQGSPGMEQGMKDDIYDVILLYKDGTSKVYATYRGKTKISK